MHAIPPRSLRLAATILAVASCGTSQALSPDPDYTAICMGSHFVAAHVDWVHVDAPVCQPGLGCNCHVVVGLRVDRVLAVQAPPAGFAMGQGVAPGRTVDVTIAELRNFAEPLGDVCAGAGASVPRGDVLASIAAMPGAGLDPATGRNADAYPSSWWPVDRLESLRQLLRLTERSKSRCPVLLDH